MQNFNFDEWTFTYGEGDGTTGSNTYYLKDILSQSDIFMTPNCDRPIIKRSGITKLIKYFEFVEGRPEIQIFENVQGVGFIVLTQIGFNTKEREKEINTENRYTGYSFMGEGEASPKNLQAKLGLDYPVAVSVKRARSRGILSHLGLDAFGEDESPDFVDYSSLNVDELYGQYGESFAKRILLGYIKVQSKKTDPPMESKDIMFITRMCMGLTEDQTIKQSDIGTADLVKVATTIEILRTLGTEKAYEYAKS